MSQFTAILDACVLYPAPLRDFLMHLALMPIAGTLSKGCGILSVIKGYPSFVMDGCSYFAGRRLMTGLMVQSESPDRRL